MATVQGVLNLSPQQSFPVSCVAGGSSAKTSAEQKRLLPRQGDLPGSTGRVAASHSQDGRDTAERVKVGVGSRDVNAENAWAPGHSHSPSFFPLTNG